MSLLYVRTIKTIHRYNSGNGDKLWCKPAVSKCVPPDTGFPQENFLYNKINKRNYDD